MRLTRLLVGLLLALTGLAATTAATPANAADVGTADANCSDFPTQAAAQRYFLNHGGPNSDPDGLDADGDGIACESNPCPCSDDQGGGGGGGGGNPPPPDPIIKQQARVISVIDGDTIRVKIIRGPRELVELIGVDAQTVKPKQCGGIGARDSLRQILPRGTRVKLTSDRKVSKNSPKGHLNRYVESRRHEAGRYQLLQGWGRTDTNNFTRKRVYTASVRQAQRRNEGIWGGCPGL